MIVMCKTNERERERERDESMLQAVYLLADIRFALFIDILISRLGVSNFAPLGAYKSLVLSYPKSLQAREDETV